MDRTVVLQHLAALEERGLVRLSGEGAERMVRFKHALAREAAYDAILSGRRAELHRQVADALAALYPEHDLSLSLTLANHWLNARAWERFAAEITPRGESLINGGWGRMVIELIDRLPPDVLSGDEAIDLVILRGLAHEAIGEYERARDLYEQALSRSSDTAVCARLYYHLGLIHSRLSQYGRAVELHNESLQLALQAGDKSQEARTRRGLGMAYWNASDYVNAARCLEDARDQSAELQDDVHLARCEMDLANVYRDRGDYAEAIEAAKRALQRYSARGLLLEKALSEQVLGACYYSAGDLQAAAESYEQATEASRRLGDPLGEVTGLCNLAELYADLGQLAKSADYFRRAAEAAERLNNDYLLAFALTGLAGVLCTQADPRDEALLDQAMGQGERALAVATRANSAERIGAAERVLAQVQAARGNREDARAHAAAAVRLLEQVGHALELKRAREVLVALEQSVVEDKQGG